MCHYIFVKTIEYTTPRVNPNVNYGVRVLMMCQYRFISCNKYTTLVGMSRRLSTYGSRGYVGTFYNFQSVLL